MVNTKKIILVFCLFLASLLNAQTLTGTAPTKKKLILEEFTGASCVACPQGHQKAQSILSNNPDKAFVIAYHPSKINLTTGFGYTAPMNTGDPDMRRDFSNAFFTSSYGQVTSLFLPGAFINRRLNCNARYLSTAYWEQLTAFLLQEISPVNVGLNSIYNAANQTLSITVETYYTQTVTENNRLFVLITEDNIVAAQMGSTSNYLHQHVFRESVTSGQWGELITEPTTSGSLVTRNYTFNLSNARDPINISNAHVIAFVMSESPYHHILTGYEVKASGGITAIEDNQFISEPSFMVFPNPFENTTKISVDLPDQMPVEITIYDMLGKEINHRNFGKQGKGLFGFEINKEEVGLVTGNIYFLTLKASERLFTKKLLVE